MLAILVGAGLVAASVWNDEQERVETENRALAGSAADAVVRTVDVAANSLRGAQGLLDAGGELRRSRFRRFARGVLESGPFDALSWQPLVRGPSRRSFVERRIHRPIVGIDPNGGTTQLGRRARYFPIEFVYPLTRARRAFVGLDVASDPVRAFALLSARDTGVPRMTGPIVSVRTGTPAVTLFNPVYRPGEPIDTLRQRRRALQGLISGGLVLNRIGPRTLEQLPDGSRVHITDDGRSVIGSPIEGDHTATAVARVAGRRWRVEAGRPEEPSPGGAVAIAGGGLLLAVLAMLLFALTDRRELRLESRRRDAEQRARRDALRARAAEVLERGHTVGERLGALARALVPAVADVCIVDVDFGETGWHRVAVAGVDEETERVVAEARRNGDARPELDGRTEPALLKPVPAGTLGRGGPNGGDEGPDPIGASSAMILPLSARDLRLGVMVLAKLHRTGRPDFTADDLEQMRDVATRAALALDSARLYERERATARTLQQHLLPSALPELPGIEVAAAYRAGGEGMEVGGDFYDVFAVPGGWVAVVGDVCGSGAEAASLTSLLRHTLRTGARLADPEHALALVDAAAREETGGATFLTLAAAWMDERPSSSGAIGVRLAIAGHPEPRVARADGSVERIAPNGPLLGVIDRWSLETTRIELGPGETLLLFTDGVTEARRSGQLFGEERLEQLLRANLDRPLDQVLSAIEKAVVEFAGGEIGDDLAMLAIRPRSQPA